MFLCVCLQILLLLREGRDSPHSTDHMILLWRLLLIGHSGRAFVPWSAQTQTLGVCSIFLFTGCIIDVIMAESEGCLSLSKARAVASQAVAVTTAINTLGAFSPFP